MNRDDAAAARLPRTQREVLEVLRLCGRTHAYDVKLRLRSVLKHSSVYAALARAEAKGYVRSEWEESDDRRQEHGPPRKYYELTTLGESALASSASAKIVRRGASARLGSQGAQS